MPFTTNISTERKRKWIAEYKVWNYGVVGSLRLAAAWSGTVWGEIWKLVLSCCVVTAVLGVLHIGTPLTPAYPWEIKFDGHRQIGPAIAFLIVFYCGNAYKCYWEGRTLLGALVYNARELYSKTVCYAPHCDSELGELAQRHRLNVLRYTICTVVVINKSVQSHWDKVEWERRRRKGRQTGSTPEERAASLMPWDFMGFALARPSVSGTTPLAVLAEHLNPDELRLLHDMKANHALLPLVWLRQQINSAEQLGLLNSEQSHSLDENVADMQQVWNGMMKIKTTPLPFPFAHMLYLFLWVYVTTMAVPLISITAHGANLPGALVITVSSVCEAIVAFLLFGLVEIGRELEDPFGEDENDFDLAAFERTIVGDLSGFQRQERDPHGRLRELGCALAPAVRAKR